MRYGKDGMKISDLISELEEMRDAYGDLAIRIAYQSSWPLAGKIANVWVDEDGDDDEDDDAEPSETAMPKKVWLAVDAVDRRESPYAPREAWNC